MRRKVCNKTVCAFKHSIFIVGNYSDAMTLDGEETLSVNGDDDLNQRLVELWY